MLPRDPDYGAILNELEDDENVAKAVSANASPVRTTTTMTASGGSGSSSSSSHSSSDSLTTSRKKQGPEDRRRAAEEARQMELMQREEREVQAGKSRQAGKTDHVPLKHRSVNCITDFLQLHCSIL